MKTTGNTPTDSTNQHHHYRYDKWLNLINLDGQKLSARYAGTPFNFPHHQVETAKRTLKKGEGVFTVFFWNSLDIAIRQSLTSNSFFGPVVLQRVRCDHDYLSSFHQDEDEYLPGEATICWKIEPVEEGQSYSRDGVSIRDLEVLDLDGVWRTYHDSEIMAPTHKRLARAGFRPFYYGTYAWDVYHASCRARGSDGRSRLIVLLYSPPECNDVILNREDAISEFMTSFMGDHQISMSDVDLYIFADTLESGAKPHIEKYDVSKASILRDYEKVSQGLLRKKLLVSPRRLEVNLHDLTPVPNETHEDWLIDLFRLPTGKEITQRSRKALEHLSQSMA